MKKTIMGMGAVVTMALASATFVAPSQAASTSGAGHGRVTSSRQLAILRQHQRAGTLSRIAGSKGCGNLIRGRALRCDYRVLTTSKSSRTTMSSYRPIGYGATDLQKAYALSAAASAKGKIVIIDAGAYPNLEADLAVYRAQYGMAPCNRGNRCFKQENYLGKAPYKRATDEEDQFIEEEVAVETALDVEMASAACPKCSITEIQVPVEDAAPESQKSADAAVLRFSKAVKLAHEQHASAVSISYGYPTDRSTDGGTVAKNMTQPGMAIYGSTGDSGYNMREMGGESWPANLRTVVAAGGTSLVESPGSSRGFSETGWNGGGSGCSPDLAAANGQPAAVAAVCRKHRAASDISAVADPFTGVAVYDTYAPASGMPYYWLTVGGTSASAPFLAGMNARAGVGKAQNGPNLIYRAKKASLHDITIGQNAPRGICEADGYASKLCHSGPGWDGITGVGTPNGLAAFGH